MMKFLVSNGSPFLSQGKGFGDGFYKSAEADKKTILQGEFLRHRFFLFFINFPTSPFLLSSKFSSCFFVFSVVKIFPRAGIAIVNIR
jgi:hypothetical protein